LAQLVERAVIVVSHIAQGLPQLVADFRESVALEEVESQGLPLILGQSGQELFQAITPKDSFRGVIRFGGSNSGQALNAFLGVYLVIEAAAREIAAAVNGSLIGHVDDPGVGGAICSVEQSGFLLKEKEQLL